MSSAWQRPRLDDAALRAIVEGTAAEIEERFFDELVRHLARALGTRCAWVIEWLESERRLRAISFWVGDGYHGAYEYAVANTPCEQVVDDRRLIHVPDRVVDLYPHDPDLGPLGGVSYMGVPLLDTDGRLLGHLAVLHDAPMPEDAQVVAIFRIFAGRAAAELRRVRRDRELREREQRLSRLIDSVMDAILTLDGDLVIVGMNSAAEKVFGRSLADVADTPFAALLAPEAAARLRKVAAELGGQPEGRQSLWIPDPLEAVRAGGGRVRADSHPDGRRGRLH